MFHSQCLPSASMSLAKPYISTLLLFLLEDRFCSETLCQHLQSLSEESDGKSYRLPKWESTPFAEPLLFPYFWAVYPRNYKSKETLACDSFEPWIWRPHWFLCFKKITFVPQINKNIWIFFAENIQKHFAMELLEDGISKSHDRESVLLLGLISIVFAS